MGLQVNLTDPEKAKLMKRRFESDRKQISEVNLLKSEDISSIL